MLRLRGLVRRGHEPWLLRGLLMGIFRRRESAADDNARTGRLLEGLETAYESRRQGLDLPLTQFEEVVIDASVTLSGEPYPPAGHTYPRKG
ncbi:hypothetical protein [Rhodococcus koreensis]|uniref:hypothetical protein n=1 Tax=Rhodococcus koreensis TaxID=99653 RepID=UPI0036DF4BF7